jgi:vitamin B12 transporter
MLDAPIASADIVITAARAPEEEARTPASVTVIGEERIDRLGEPLVPALLRLAPSTSVSTSGPAGSLTQVRIRGAEANHTLLFIDGIRVNDPASGNQPRFELLNADIASRIELIRGPQSALWGSEAIGGVIAINGVGASRTGYSVNGEAGSFGFRRGSASGDFVTGYANASAALGWQRSRGIDAFEGNGDRDGYRNLSGRLHASWAPSPTVELGASAVALTGRSEFDGFSPITFLRADTLDSSRNRLFAGRLWARMGGQEGPWTARLSSSLLGSTNRNLLEDDEINRTRGRRWNLAGQVERRFVTGAIAHQLILAGDHEREEFRARDVIFGGFSNQDRKRDHQALTAEWRAEAGPVVTDVAIRRDRFSSFRDATSIRASGLVELGSGLAIAASYGEGIAQPTFFDLFGFFPGSFVGNPDLKSESSCGIEGSLRFRRSNLEGSLTLYRQRLSDEIVDLFDPATFLSTTANRDENSRRSGLEAEFGWALGQRLRLTGNYSYLRATEPSQSGNSQLREVRRPKHSGAVALDGASGRLSYGVSLAYTGARRDMNFDIWPPQAVRLGAYWLGGARIAYDVGRNAELFGRVANAFDENYEDVVGHRTEGRSAYAGIRLAFGR